jgi:thiamine biosynthesis lipoprotein
MPPAVEPGRLEAGVCACSCQAMATVFRIELAESQAAYARQAAAAAFEELQLLERLLSRYREGSDVSRINRLPAGQKTVVALETFACLQLALEACRKTDGAFDVTYASHGAGRTTRLRLDPNERTVQVLQPGVQVDLGGIGKGFALDHMAGLLRQWDIAAARLWASASTVLAFGSSPGGDGWSVTFGSAADRRRHILRGTALSGSGNAVKGRHIVCPQTGTAVPGGRRSWATASTAALADALSTAWMAMHTAAIRRCCRTDPSVAAFVVDGDDQPLMVCGS